MSNYFFDIHASDIRFPTSDLWKVRSLKDDEVDRSGVEVP